MSNEDRTVSSMVRKQLLISVEQERQLKTLSAAKSRSEGDLVREAVDEWLVRQGDIEQSWKDAWRQAAGVWENREDLDDLYRERRERRKQRRDGLNQLMARGKPG
jgi:predicted phage-related endonuclease